MTSNEELKPCPFCGGEAELVEHNGDLIFYSVSCKNENCFAGAVDVRHFGKETLVEAWNRRADDAD